MDINDSVMEGSCTGVQIHIPHTKETFVEHFSLFLYMACGKLSAQHRRVLVVMKTEIFHIHGMEIILSQTGQDLPEAWNRSARENIFFDPGISGMLFQSADKVKEEYAAFFQDFADTVYKKLVVWSCLHARSYLR